MEVLAPHDLAAKIPFARIVVRRDLRAIRKESEPVPVPEETLHRFYGRGRIAFFGLFAEEVLFQRTNRPFQIDNLVRKGGDDLLVFFVTVFPPGKSLSVRAGETLMDRAGKLFRRGRPFDGSGRISLGEDLRSLPAPVVPYADLDIQPLRFAGEGGTRLQRMLTKRERRQ